MKQNRFHIGIGSNAPNQEFSMGTNSYSIKSSTKRGRAVNDGFNSYTDQQRYIHQSTKNEQQKIVPVTIHNQAPGANYQIPEKSSHFDTNDASPRGKQLHNASNQPNFPMIANKKPSVIMSTNTGISKKVHSKQQLNSQKKQPS